MSLVTSDGLLLAKATASRPVGGVASASPLALATSASSPLELPLASSMSTAPGTRTDARLDLAEAAALPPEYDIGCTADLPLPPTAWLLLAAAAAATMAAPPGAPRLRANSAASSNMMICSSSPLWPQP